MSVILFLRVELTIGVLVVRVCAYYGDEGVCEGGVWHTPLRSKDRHYLVLTYSGGQCSCWYASYFVIFVIFLKLNQNCLSILIFSWSYESMTLKRRLKSLWLPWRVC